MICDHNLHASLVEGALRSPARTMRFRHNDLEHFERCLENCPPEEKILIVSEGVFSMEGDIADLRGIVRLAKPYGARVYVDEAHGIGVLGATGAGAAEHLGVLDDMDIVMGTFSKSLASVGGFIAAERDGDRLSEAHRAAVRFFGQPAAGIGGGGRPRRCEIMQQEPERRRHLLRIAQMLRDELRARGFSVLPGETAIVPVVVREELDLCRLCKALLEEGIYINPVLRPARRAEPAADLLHGGAYRKPGGETDRHSGEDIGGPGSRTVRSPRPASYGRRRSGIPARSGRGSSVRALLLHVVPALAFEHTLHHEKDRGRMALLVFIQRLIDLSEGLHLDTGHLGLKRGITIYGFIDVVLAFRGRNSLADLARLLAIWSRMGAASFWLSSMTLFTSRF